MPVESLLSPGLKQQFQVRLFNKNGQYLGLAKAEDVKYELKGPGSIDETGKYTTPGPEAGHVAASVSAEVKGLKADAKMRIVPKLNWTFDFDDMQVPITWIGARYRHIPLDFDLFETLRAKDPKAGGLYIYLNTAFTNGGKPTATLDDSVPGRETWTDMLRYFDLDGAQTKPTTVDAAKAIFDPLLETLKAENVVTDWKWDEWSREVGGTTISGPKLTVNQGKREKNGNGVLCKISTIPKGTRSQAWMGQTGYGNYSIQSDVYAISDGTRLADVGLIAQRYTIDLMGEAQQMQIRTWPPVLRMAQSKGLKWEGNTWYTIKLEASTEDGKAILKGKIWKRGEEEPAEWFMEAVDEAPNTIGSPGLYGNAKGVELLYDNLTVTKN